MRLGVFLCALVLAVAPLSAAEDPKPCPRCGKIHAQATDSAGEVVRLVNLERSRRGLPALVEVNNLGADAHARTMHSRRRMYHAGRWPENVAVGQRTPQHVMNTWMRSSGHRANILRRGRTQIDVGRSGNYWVQRFR